MSQNLDQLKSTIETQIPVSGAPGTITGQNHQNILKEVLSNVGKYAGMIYTAISDGVPLLGQFSWMNTPMNTTSPFVVKFNQDTDNGQKIINLISVLRVDDWIKFKDYKGRVAFLKYKSHALAVESGENIVNVTVEGVPENPAIAYSGGETNECVFEFFLKGATKTSELVNDSGFVTSGSIPTDYVPKSTGGQFDGNVQIVDGDGIIYLGADGTFAIRTNLAPNAIAFRVRSAVAGKNEYQFRALPLPSASLDSSFQSGHIDDPSNDYFDGVSQNAFNGQSGLWWTQFWQPNTLLTIGGNSGLISGYEQGDKFRVIDGKVWVDGDIRSKTARFLNLSETTEEDSKTLVVESDGNVAFEQDIPSESLTLTTNYGGSIIVSVTNGHLQIDVNVTKNVGSGTIISTLPSYFRHFKYSRVPFSSPNVSTVGFLEFRPWNGEIALTGNYASGSIVVSRSLPFRL